MQRLFVRGSLVVALVVVLVLTVRPAAWARTSSRPAATTRAIDDGATTVEQLEARPLRVPRLRHGERCPRAHLEQVTTGVGPAVRAGPVAAAAVSARDGVGIGPVVTDDGWRAGKVLWLVQRSQREPVIVRGRRVDRPGKVRFRFGVERGTAVGELDGDANSTAGADYRDMPSSLEVRSGGCYALQVDGPDFQSVLTLRVTRNRR